MSLPEPATPVWQPVELSFVSTRSHSWNSFPIQVRFIHDSGKTHTLDAYFEGGARWGVRFAPSLPGQWRWESLTPDIHGPRSGTLAVRAASMQEVAANPNLRGHLRARSGERYFRRADGTPFFFLGDTNWYALTCRTGIDQNSHFCGEVLDHDVSFGKRDESTRGPANNNFDVWLQDRVRKGFNGVMIRYVPRNLNGSNEGGCGFPSGPDPLSLSDCETSDWSNLNPGFFAQADRRMKRLWQNGLVIAGHPNWLASSTITIEEAKDFTRYLLARYGAYALIWSLSGEFQNTGGRKTHWGEDRSRFEPFRQLGRSLRSGEGSQTWFERYNYHHPVSIHPVGSPPRARGAQTSVTTFKGEPWIDHHWVQTYTHPEQIESRVKETWESAKKPVLMAEPCYENFSQDSSCDRYQTRYSAWVAALSGAAGHAYGVQGIYRMNGTSVQNLATPGSTDVIRVLNFLDQFFVSNDWADLSPFDCSGNQSGNWASNPICAKHPNGYLVAYLPQGREEPFQIPETIGLDQRDLRWFNPRTGASHVSSEAGVSPEVTRPDASDWVLVIQ
ncbi:MAG: DUF4038 domain-containing protein [Pseudomonadota bacterium]